MVPEIGSGDLTSTTTAALAVYFFGSTRLATMVNATTPPRIDTTSRSRPRRMTRNCASVISALVQHRADDARLRLADARRDALHAPEARRVPAHHDERSPRARRDGLRIGARARRRAVDQHHVGLRAELAQELRECRPREQVLRIGR